MVPTLRESTEGNTMRDFDNQRDRAIEYIAEVLYEAMFRGSV